MVVESQVSTELAEVDVATTNPESITSSVLVQVDKHTSTPMITFSTLVLMVDIGIIDPYDFVSVGFS